MITRSLSSVVVSNQTNSDCNKHQGNKKSCYKSHVSSLLGLVFIVKTI